MEPNLVYCMNTYLVKKVYRESRQKSSYEELGMHLLMELALISTFTITK